MKKLYFVRAADNMFVGMASDPTTPCILQTPRTLGMGNQDGSIILQVCIGDPTEMYVTDPIYWYENQDEKFLEFYNNHVMESSLPTVPEEKSPIIQIVKH